MGTTGALKTEINSTEMEGRVCAAFTERYGSARIHADFEHGQWWITNLDSGAQWSVVDADGGPAIDGFDFERVG